MFFGQVRRLRFNLDEVGFLNVDCDLVNVVLVRSRARFARATSLAIVTVARQVVFVDDELGVEPLRRMPGPVRYAT